MNKVMYLQYSNNSQNHTLSRLSGKTHHDHEQGEKGEFDGFLSAGMISSLCVLPCIVSDVPNVEGVWPWFFRLKC